MENVFIQLLRLSLEHSILFESICDLNILKESSLILLSLQHAMWCYGTKATRLTAYFS